MANLLMDKGFRKVETLMYVKEEGGEHTESAWARLCASCASSCERKVSSFSCASVEDEPVCKSFLWRARSRLFWSREAVTESTGDLGLVPAFAIAGAGPWWTALEFDTAPKIIARLPFVERADHPAGLPVFVISRVAADAMVTETEVWSMRVSGWSAMSVDSLAGLADAIAVPDRAFDGAALLISVARGGIDAVAEALRGTGASIRSKALVGSHASRYTVPSK